MGGTYERCGHKQTKNGWNSCNRKKGHKGNHSNTKMLPVTYWRQDDEEKKDA